jgi:hypothetical protein
MRKIESQMNAAIKAGRDWKCDNTEVICCSHVSDVFLHGNQIARIGETWIELFDGGYQSATTKSRLNAILSGNGETGDRVFQKAGKWFVQLNSVQGLTTVPFFSGMRF